MMVGDKYVIIFVLRGIRPRIPVYCSSPGGVNNVRPGVGFYTFVLPDRLPTDRK